MRYPVNIPELPGCRIEVELPGVFSSATVLVDGQPATKALKRGQFFVRATDGRESLLALKTSFLDPVPQVLWAGRTIQLVEPLAWYQWLWTGIPLVLALLGGAIGVLVSYAVAAAVGTLPLMGPLFEDDSGRGDIHLHISVATLAVSTFVLLLVGVISGLIPALRASKLDPVEALRYE